jgi:hypothetical protein
MGFHSLKPSTTFTCMTVVINKGESQISIDRKLRRLAITKKSIKGFPAHKFLGKIKTEGDPLEIQKKLRDEWRAHSR